MHILSALSRSDHRESKDSSPASSCFSSDLVISLSPLPCALPDKLSVLQGFGYNRPPLGLLDATLTMKPISVASKGFTGYLSPLESALTKKPGGGGAPNLYTLQPANIPAIPAGPIAGHSLWCHNPQRYEIGRQPRETNSSRPVSKGSERTFFLVPAKRTSGTARVGFQGLYLHTLG
jgi:hypothetical protein